MGVVRVENLSRHSLILSVLMLVVGLASLDKYLVGFTINVLVATYGFAASDLSMMLSMFQIGFIVSTVGGGFLVDKYGYKRFMLAAFALLAGVSAVFGFVSSLPMLVFLRFLAGLGAAGFVVAVPKAISSVYTADEASRVQAKATPACGIAGIVTALMGQALLSGAISLQQGYLLLAALFVFLVVCIQVVLPDARPKASALSFKSLTAAYKNKSVILLSIIYALFNLVTVAMLNWLPMTFSQFEGATPTIISATMFGFYILETLVLVSAGPLVNKHFWDATNKLLVICAVGSAITLIAFSFSSNLVMGILTMYVATVFVILASGVIVLLPYRYVEPEIMGSSFAAVNVGGRIGGIVSPFVANLFVASSGVINFSYAFMAYALIVAMACIFIKLLPQAH